MPGPMARETLNAIVLSATALGASARGTLVKTSVLRSVRSKTALTPDNTENTNRCHTCNTL